MSGDGEEKKLGGYTSNDTSTFHFIAAVNLVVSCFVCVSTAKSSREETRRAFVCARRPTSLALLNTVRRECQPHDH